MDFGSWKLGLNFLKNKNVENLLLVNDSIIGPFIDIRKILDSMKNKKVDFWELHLLVLKLSSIFRVIFCISKISA